MPHPDRRHFLATCAASVAAGVTTSQLGWSNQSAARASEPIQRNGTAQFKFSLAAYSYRKLLQGKSATLSLTDFIDDCARFGLEGTELTSYYFPDPVTPEYLRSLKHHCFRLGLDVSGTAVGNDFGSPDKETRQAQIKHVKNWIEHAEILGAPVIRVFAGHVKKDSTPDEAHRLMVSSLEECCEYAGQHGVHLALENHGGPTATPDGLLRLVHDVKSDWFGVNLDTGNFHTEDIYGDLARIAPYALNVQIKSTISGPDKKKVPSDFKKLAGICRDAGYRGYIVLEYEESGDPRAESARYLDLLRQAFRA
ncbi:MAG: xylose isomerase [Blastopirellula sp.]|nr:xylose isomerase [Blastopirellula sp.]